MVADEPKVSEPNVAPPMVAFFYGDSDDDATANEVMNRQDYRVLNKKLDSLIHYAWTFSTSNFENMVIVHQGVMKRLQSKHCKIFWWAKTVNFSYNSENL